MQQKLADQVTEWISNCETFDRWIDSESNRLEDLLKLPTEEVTLDKVLVEEQAIRVRPSYRFVFFRVRKCFFLMRTIIYVGL